MAKSFTVQFDTLGSGLDNFNLTSNSGPVTPSTATRSQLLAGLLVTVSDAATQLTITSTGQCTNSYNISLGSAPLDYAFITGGFSIVNNLTEPVTVTFPISEGPNIWISSHTVQPGNNVSFVSGSSNIYFPQNWRIVLDPSSGAVLTPSPSFTATNASISGLGTGQIVIQPNTYNGTPTQLAGTLAISMGSVQ
jgi:hypothetical protein